MTKRKRDQINYPIAYAESSARWLLLGIGCMYVCVGFIISHAGFAGLLWSVLLINWTILVHRCWNEL